LNPLTPRCGGISILANVILQVLDILVAGDDKAEETFMAACLWESLFRDLNHAKILLGRLGGGFRGPKEKIRFLNVLHRVDFFRVYAWAEEEIE
jgi:hypothetical protein